MTFPVPGVTPGNWGQQLLDEIQAIKDRAPSGIKSGNWTYQPGGTNSTQTLAATQIACSPLIVPTAFTAQTVQIEVTTAGGAGCVVRLGLFGVGSDGLPGAVLFDWGTVVASSTGVKPITISSIIPAGYLYLALAVQGTFTGNPTFRAIANAGTPVNQGSVFPTGGGASGYYGGPVAGAFAASPAGMDVAEPISRIALRAA